LNVLVVNVYIEDIVLRMSFWVQSISLTHSRNA